MNAEQLSLKQNPVEKQSAFLVGFASYPGVPRDRLLFQ